MFLEVYLFLNTFDRTHLRLKPLFFALELRLFSCELLVSKNKVNEETNFYFDNHVNRNTGLDKIIDVSLFLLLIFVITILKYIFICLGL